MFGLIVLAIIGLYFLISIGVVRKAMAYARANGKSAKRWGWGAALGMYLLVFWDWIPTVVAHKYYCSTEAGFWVYKTPEQWKKENSGVLETLVANKGAPSEREGNMESYTDTYLLNQRFNWVVKRHGKFLFNRWLHEQRVVDTKTGEVLAKYVDFSTSQISPQAGWNGWKMWLVNEHCSDGGANQDALRNYRNNFMGAR
jgi:hypothetical protein